MTTHANVDVRGQHFEYIYSILSIYMALIYLLFTLLAQFCKRNKVHKNKTGTVTVVEKSFNPKSSKSGAKQSVSS